MISMPHLAVEAGVDAGSDRLRIETPAASEIDEVDDGAPLSVDGAKALDRASCKAVACSRRPWIACCVVCEGFACKFVCAMICSFIGSQCCQKFLIGMVEMDVK